MKDTHEHGHSLHSSLSSSRTPGLQPWDERLHLCWRNVLYNLNVSYMKSIIHKMYHTLCMTGLFQCYAMIAKSTPPLSQEQGRKEEPQRHRQCSGRSMGEP